MANSPWIFSCVERGWAASRMCALELKDSGISIHHYIKGYVDPEVLKLIQPYPHCGFTSLPRKIFRVLVYLRLLFSWVGKKPRWILVDNAKTGKLLSPVGRLLGAEIIQVELSQDGLALAHNGLTKTVQEFFKLGDTAR